LGCFVPHGAIPAPPDRAGPGGVGFEAGDDMDVKLAHDVAKGSNVHFMGGGYLLQGSRGGGNFLPEFLLVLILKEQ
jgi:hypothetical protein